MGINFAAKEIICWHCLHVIAAVCLVSDRSYSQHLPIRLPYNAADCHVRISDDEEKILVSMRGITWLISSRGVDKLPDPVSDGPPIGASVVPSGRVCSSVFVGNQSLALGRTSCISYYPVLQDNVSESLVRRLWIGTPLAEAICGVSHSSGFLVGVSEEGRIVKLKSETSEEVSRIRIHRLFTSCCDIGNTLLIAIGDRAPGGITILDKSSLREVCYERVLDHAISDVSYDSTAGQIVAASGYRSSRDAMIDLRKPLGSRMAGSVYVGKLSDKGTLSLTPYNVPEACRSVDCSVQPYCYILGASRMWCLNLLTGTCEEVSVEHSSAISAIRILHKTNKFLIVYEDGTVDLQHFDPSGKIKRISGPSLP